MREISHHHQAPPLPGKELGRVHVVFLGERQETVPSLEEGAAWRRGRGGQNTTEGLVVY